MCHGNEITNLIIPLFQGLYMCTLYYVHVSIYSKISEYANTKVYMII